MFMNNFPQTERCKTFILNYVYVCTYECKDSDALGAGVTGGCHPPNMDDRN